MPSELDWSFPPLKLRNGSVFTNMYFKKWRIFSILHISWKPKYEQRTQLGLQWYMTCFLLGLLFIVQVLSVKIFLSVPQRASCVMISGCCTCSEKKNGTLLCWASCKYEPDYWKVRILCVKTEIQTGIFLKTFPIGSDTVLLIFKA